MGLFDVFRRSSLTSDVLAGPSYDGMVSPFATGGALNQIVWSDVFNASPVVFTRAEALSIPAVAKARGILLALIADKPLRAFDENGVIANQPAWLTRTDGEISPWTRMQATLDDVIFDGFSLWATERENDEITNALHIPFDRWEFDSEGRILVDKKRVQAAEVILFVGATPGGLCQYAARSLRGAIALERSWVDRAEHPAALIELHENVASGIDEDDVKNLVSAWNKARTTPGGATAYTPNTVDVRTHGDTDAQLFIEGRNFTRIDVASFFGLPAQILDGSLAQSTLTYSTSETGRNEVLDYSIPLWTRPLEGRLSQDDVIAPGSRIRFDLETLITSPQAPTGAVVAD